MSNNKIDRTITISISTEMLDDIDLLRHDISRSRWIQKIIQEKLTFLEQLQ
jgi:hypothetical protein